MVRIGDKVIFWDGDRGFVDSFGKNNMFKITYTKINDPKVRTFWTTYTSFTEAGGTIHARKPVIIIEQ